MSKFSHEYHVRLPQARVAELLEVFHLTEGAEDVSVGRGFALARAALDAEDFKRRAFVVSPTDAEGWSVVWAGRGDLDGERLLAGMSAAESCDAVYGHNNDGVDNWRWIIFRGGPRDGEYWYVGQAWARRPDGHAPESLTLREAFESAGRRFHHLTVSEVVAREWRNFGGAPEEFVTVLATSRD